jgi:hypothetical protein
LNVNLTALSVSIFDGDGGGLVLDDLSGEIADNKWDSIEHRKDRFDGIGRIIQKNEANNDDVALDALGCRNCFKILNSEIERVMMVKEQQLITMYYGDAYDNAF